MDYNEYLETLKDAETKGTNHAVNEVVRALRFMKKGDKANAYEVLAELLNYKENETLEKLLSYEAPNYNDSDVPF